MNDDKDDKELKFDKENFVGKIGQLRDDETEGYNIIPNFFISATMDKDLSYRDDIHLTEKNNKYFTSSQFKNRLFDRDTMLICHYDVNFLFVVSLYARNNSLQKSSWKDKVRRMFRTQIQNMLEEHYTFYAMGAKPKTDGKKFIKTHFQDVLGKIYAPYNGHDILSLALEKEDPEQNNEKLLDLLKKVFYIKKIKLGENPEYKLRALSTSSIILPLDKSEKNVLTGLVRKSDNDSQKFFSHEGKTYVMERIPNINLLGVKYFLPMVGGKIDGYYEIERLSVTFNNGKSALRLRLGEYYNIGEKWVQIYRTKMQPGELISLDTVMNMYKQET
jgi:hypothetical protein